MTEPVSGSKKVSIDGIKVNIINVRNDLFFVVYVDNIKIKESLVSSLGWNEKFSICIQAFDPLMERSNIRTYVSNIMEMIYRGIINFDIYLKFILDTNISNVYEIIRIINCL